MHHSEGENEDASDAAGVASYDDPTLVKNKN